jgi:hypothetical protein
MLEPLLFLSSSCSIVLGGPHPRPTAFQKKNLVASEIESGTSESVARNSDHYTTEAVSDVERMLHFRCHFTNEASSGVPETLTNLMLNSKPML